ncbi:MAG: hypothetical protein EON54_06825 [Alcaligenaceae bacterium]|nr:MAG: hypothetical protein EON54_06825 [Alcaligenaceae bacterium]
MMASQNPRTTPSPESPAFTRRSAGVLAARRTTLWVGFYVVLAVVVLLVANAIQMRQDPCGNRFDLTPSIRTMAGWTCPIEINAHNRPDGHIASVRFSSLWLGPEGRRGWVVGSDEKGTAILATEDGGKTWRAQYTKLGAELQSIALTSDARYGLAVGSEGMILATRDGGQTWQVQPTDLHVDLRDVFFMSDGQRGWAAGSEGTIVVTRDGGRTWQAQVSDSRELLLGIVFTADALRGWAVGTDGTILATPDGGQTWRSQASGSEARLQSIDFADDGQRGRIAGSRGTILETHDGGRTWQAQASGSRDGLRSIAFTTDNRSGWAVGTGGTILSTRDGGLTWKTQHSGTRAWLRSIVVTQDGKRGWTVGGEGTILATLDAGNTWTPIGRYGRYAPLWFLCLSGVLLAGGVALVAVSLKVRRHVVIGDRILSHAIADEPLSSAEQDRLNFIPIVDALAAFLRHEATRPPLTIAVTAPWGRGKSSFMRLLRKRLARRGAPAVWFNAWHHQKEPVLLAALLSSVVAQSVPPWLSIRGLVFRTRLVWRRFLKQPTVGLLPAGLWLLLLASTIGSALACIAQLLLNDGSPSSLNPTFEFWMGRAQNALKHLIDNAATELLLSGEWSKFARETLGALGQDPGKVAPIVLTFACGFTIFFLFSYYSRPFPARPSALLAGFGARFSMSQAEDQTTFRERFRDHFRDVTEALRPYTLTVFIDDLDRCESAKCAEMLEAVNYLVDSGRCFVVLGISRDIVEAQLGDAYSGLAEKKAEFKSVDAESRNARSRSSAKFGPEFLRNWLKLLPGSRKKAVTGMPQSPSKPAESESSRQSARIRREFAQNYLHKLIQIEVPVPAFEKAQVATMLSDELRREMRAEFWWELWGSAVERLKLLTRVGLTAVVAVWLFGQISVWLDIQKGQVAAAAAKVAEKAHETEARLEARRRYVAYLRQDVEDRRKELPANVSSGAALLSAPVPTTRRTRDLRLELASQEAALGNAQALIVRAEAAVLRMTDQTRQHQTIAAERTIEEIEELTKRLVDLEKSDTLYQVSLSAERARRASTAAEAASEAGKAEEPEPTESDANPGVQQDWAAAQWPQVLLIAMVMSLGITALILGMGRYVIRENENYRRAAEAWSSVLYSDSERRAPREVKRYFNFSRYLTMRLNGTTYVPVPRLKKWLNRLLKVPPAKEASVGETCIAALAVLYLVRPPAFRNGNAYNFLLDPIKAVAEMSDAAGMEELMAAIRAAKQTDKQSAWTAEEVASFLDAVGEIKVDRSNSTSRTDSTRH